MEQQIKKQILVFKIDKDHWALEILKVQEIIRIVEITSIPEVSVFLEGIINLRGKIIPVINLRKMMNLPAGELNINAKIIIVSVENFPVGFVIDTVENILEIKEREIEPVKPGSYGRDFVEEIIKSEDKLIFLLNVNKVLELEKKSLTEIFRKKDYSLGQKPEEINYDYNEKKKLLQQRAIDLAKVPMEESKGEKVKIIIFLLNSEWYGVEEAEIKEILNIQKIFFVPQAPAYIEGVINVRGTVTPVLNLAKFLGMKTSSILPASKILIVDKNNITVGFLTDAIDEIIQLDWKILQHSLAALIQEKAKFVKGEFQWREKVVAILDVENIIAVKD